jgi:UDP-N-acetylglucosamine acyltransferase
MARWISDTAFVDPSAKLADGCRIGPFCHIGAGVELESDVIVKDHTWINSQTLIRSGSQIGSYCLIGKSKPFKRNAKRALIDIGRNVVLDRSVVIDSGCPSQPTQLGDNSHVHAFSKIESSSKTGHDAQLGAGTYVRHMAELGPHVTLGHGCIIERQVQVGRNTAVGAMSRVDQDLPPHMIADGRPTRMRCVNLAGLHRMKVEPLAISILVEAYRLLYKSELSCDQAEKSLKSSDLWTPEVIEFITFLRASAEKARGFRRDQGRVA